jgi:hypothetical protein
MLSVCCCSINSKFDVDNFVRILHRNNPDFDFEVVVTLDDRMQDGARQHLECLAGEFPNLKIVIHDEEDTLNYFEACIEYYEKQNIFRPNIRQTFRDNLDKYKAGELVDRARGWLWQSSGILYNKAVQASSGDVIIVTPGDFVYLFPLQALYNHVRARGAHFYASLPALWARVANLDEEWMYQHLRDIQDGKNHRSGWRWDTVEVFRDYLRFQPSAKGVYVPDLQSGTLIHFDDDTCMPKLEEFCNRTSSKRLHQFNPSFHGFHVMTRHTYDVIGGFTEEWFHRAFPDDKMTYQGNRLCGHNLPPKFCVAWCGQHEFLPLHAAGYQAVYGDKDAWHQKGMEVDPFFETHPPPPLGRKVYLNNGIHNKYMSDLVNSSLSKSTSPIRMI